MHVAVKWCGLAIALAVIGLQTVGSAVVESQRTKLSDDTEVDVATLKRGTVDTTRVGLDVAIRDENGNKFSAANPLAIQSGIVISSLNSTRVALAGGGSFVGVGEDIRQYQEVSLNSAGAPSVADGTVFFEFGPGVSVADPDCANETNWDVSVPISVAGPNSLVPQPLRNVLPCFRVRYANGATPLTELRITTTLHRTNSKHLTRFLNQNIGVDEPVENVRAIVGGQNPDGDFANQRLGGKTTALSTNTPLDIGGVFSSTIINVIDYKFIAISVKSDVNSASDGVALTWYADAAGTRVVGQSFLSYTTSPMAAPFGVQVQGAYAAISYTNGGIAQSTFELFARLETEFAGGTVQAISESIDDTDTAELTKAVIVGKQENGVNAAVGLSNSGSIKVAVTDRPSEVRGRTRVHIYMAHTSIAPACTTFYTVTAGRTLYIQSTAFSTLNDANAIGEWTLNDGTNPKSGFVLGQKAVGAPAQGANPSPAAPEPIVFTTSVRACEVAGDIHVAGFLIGYEEDN